MIAIAGTNKISSIAIIRTKHFCLSPSQFFATHLFYLVTYSRFGSKLLDTLQSSYNVCNLRYKTEQMQNWFGIQYKYLKKTEVDVTAIL